MWLALSLLAALAFGIRGSLYHWTSTLKLDRNLMLFGVFSCGALIYYILSLASGAAWQTTTLIGVQMGLFSFAASACMYKGFSVGKASIVAIFTALPPILVALFAFLAWDERFTWMQLVAFIFIMGGLIVVRYSSEISWSNMQGAQWGALTMLFFASNDISGKWSTMLGAERYPTLTYMFLTGALCFGVWWLYEQYQVKKMQRAYAYVSSTGSNMNSTAEKASHAARGISQLKTFLIGLAVGTTNAAGMYFILEAFAIGKAGLVSAVTALNVVLILLYTRMVVREKLTKLEYVGIGCILSAVMLIQLFRG